MSGKIVLAIGVASLLIPGVALAAPKRPQPAPKRAQPAPERTRPAPRKADEAPAARRGAAPRPRPDQPGITPPAGGGPRATPPGRATPPAGGEPPRTEPRREPRPDIDPAPTPKKRGKRWTRAGTHPIFHWGHGWGVDVAPGDPFPTPAIPVLEGKYGGLQLITILQGRLNVPFRSPDDDYQTYRGHFRDASTVGGVAGTPFYPRVLFGELLTPGEQNLGFEVQRVRFVLLGHLLTNNLRFLFQADAIQAPHLLDVKLTYILPWVKGLSISVGRFLPNYSLLMTRLVSRIGTAEWPIFLTEGGFAPWRDLGVEIRYSIALAKAGVLNAYVGVFNGEPNSWEDRNHMKDFLLRVDFLGKGKIRGLFVGAYAWLGFPRCIGGSTCIPAEEAQKKFDIDIRAGLFAELSRKFGTIRPHILVEGYVRKYSPRAASGAEAFDILAGGFWAHVGVRIGQWVEPLLRVEYLNITRDSTGGDPNLAGTSWTTRLTAGVNVLVKPLRSHLKINYIFQWTPQTFRYAGTPTWIDVELDRNGGGPFQLSDLHLLLLEVTTEF